MKPTFFFFFFFFFKFNSRPNVINRGVRRLSFIRQIQLPSHFHQANFPHDELTKNNVTCLISPGGGVGRGRRREGVLREEKERKRRTKCDWGLSCCCCEWTTLLGAVKTSLLWVMGLPLPSRPPPLPPLPSLPPFPSISPFIHVWVFHLSPASLPYLPCSTSPFIASS